MTDVLAGAGHPSADGRRIGHVAGLSGIHLASAVRDIGTGRVVTTELSAAKIDNTSMAETQPYLDYVRHPANGYVSVDFLARDSDSMEISCRA